MSGRGRVCRTVFMILGDGDDLPEENISEILGDGLPP